MNYVGGKYKLLPQILPYIPEDINNFVDLFAGGCNVGVNIKADNITCNDIEKVVIDLMNDLKSIDTEEALNQLKDTIEKYELSKTNEEGFKAIRNDYNNGNRSWDMFYAMLTNAFNYQIRFNKSGGYNMPFGRNRSWFNPRLEKRFIKFVDHIHNINIKFTDRDFRKLQLEKVSKDDFVYCDPPYLITCASYNENGGWTKQHEQDLYNLLDRLHNKDIKFALSNVLESKGKTHDMLIEWSKKYNVHDLNHTYGNSNYHRKDRKGSREVLITNY